MTQSDRYIMVVAIYLNSKGFAFVVFEGERAPVDWGAVEARGKTKGQKMLARIDRIFLQYKPNVVVLQKILPTEIHRPKSILRLNEAIGKLATRNSFPVVLRSRQEIRDQFAYLGSVSRDAIASVIAKHLPQFARYLPRSRKPWRSEDARVGIFDAAALALTFFHTPPEPGVERT